MFYRTEVKNGIIIWAGIGIYFLLMELFGFADLHFLRLFNGIIVIYGMNRTIKENYAHGNDYYLNNFVSALATGIIGISAALIGLVGFIYLKGGESYIQSLADTFYFTGKTNSIMYIAVLFFEAFAATVISSFLLMQFWKDVTLKNHPAQQV